MSDDPAATIPPGGDSPLEWDGDGQPRSRLYGDIYFSAADGLAESRAVFLAGCGVPEAWRGRRRFVVGELGFGSGLSIAALLDLWRREGPAQGRLHIFSVEAHPIGADEARRALAAWPELACVAELLVARWPGRRQGVHRVELPELRAILDVAVMEVGAALEGWTGRADAWFLDGFSPALNPAMWRDEVLGLVAARSRPGARAATFTVAGQVRRGLAAAGFEVSKQPGYGRKRQRLEARFPGAFQEPPPTPVVAIIGGGIAGAAAARAVDALGAKVVMVDSHGLGAGGSGNPAALVTPGLDSGLGPPAQLSAQAFARAVALYEALPGAIIARGVLQLATAERDAERFGKIAASDLFEPATLALLPGPSASARLGEPSPAALALESALTIEPLAVLRAWAPAPLPRRAARLRRDGDAWRVEDAAGELIVRAEAVIVAAAMGSSELVEGLPLSPVRGQASWAAMDEPPVAAAWGGYAAPMRDGVLFGATHDREDRHADLRPADHVRNLETLRGTLPQLAARVEGRPISGRAAVRATTPDRVPLAGPAPGMEGVFLLSGFGARGFSAAPLLAEHVAALALDAPSPLPAALAALVDPDRFRRRRLRRGAS